MEFYQHPRELAHIRSLYWRLRAIRAYDQAARRKWYRRIKRERERVLAQGWDSEHLRIYCRMMADPLRLERVAAVQAYERAAREYALLEARLMRAVVRVTYQV